MPQYNVVTGRNGRNKIVAATSLQQFFCGPILEIISYARFFINWWSKRWFQSLPTRWNLLQLCLFAPWATTALSAAFGTSDSFSSWESLLPTVAWMIEIALPWCSVSQQICCDTRAGELYRDTCQVESARASKIGTHLVKHFRHDTKLGVALSSGIAWSSGRSKNSPRRQSDASFHSSQKWPFWKRQLRSWFSNSRKRGFVKAGNFDMEAKSCFWKLEFDRVFFVARKTGFGKCNSSGAWCVSKRALKYPEKIYF